MAAEYSSGILFLFRDSSHRLFRLVLFLALALRLTVFLLAFWIRGDAAFIEPDSLDYMRLASSIASGSYTAESGFPEIARVPAYPLLLTLGYLPFLSVIPVLLLQILLDIGIMSFIYMIGLRIFSMKAALAAIFFYALSALAVSGALKMLSETLFLFCLMSALYLLLPPAEGVERKRTLLPAFLAGILIGISCLLRAVQLPLLPFFLLYGVLFWRKHDLLKNLLVFALPVMLICGAWLARNVLSSGYYGFSSISSVNTYRYNACALSASLAGRDFASEQLAFDRALSDMKSEKEKALAASEKGWTLILAHPFAYIPVHLKGSFRALLPADGELLRMLGFETGGNGTLAVMQSKGIVEGLKHYLGGRLWLLLILLPGSLLLFCEYAAAFSGFVFAMIRGRREYLAWLVLAVICVAYYLLVSGPAGHPRFRIPAEALICLFAGAGISYLADLKSYLNSSLVSGSTSRNSST